MAKAGVQTTEFWLTMLTNVTTLVGSLQGIIPADVAAIIIAVTNGIYGVIRAFTKSNEPLSPPSP